VKEQDGSMDELHPDQVKAKEFHLKPKGQNGFEPRVLYMATIKAMHKKVAGKVPNALRRQRTIEHLIDYFSFVAGPVPSLRSASPPGEMGVAVRTDSYSVTTTTPGTGSSITSMIVVSTGTSTTFLGAFLAAVFGGRFFLAAGFVVLMPARRTLDFAFFGIARFAAFLRAGLALALPRFELFLRAATRFFALAMAVSCEVCRGRRYRYLFRNCVGRCEVDHVMLLVRRQHRPASPSCAGLQSR
jgi:hypothetical protein